jgi:hypothetical protein
MTPDQNGNSGITKLVSESEAEKKAQETLAFEIGNIPHLGEAEETETEYIFPLVTTMPRVIFDESRERPVDVKFMSEDEVGEIRIDGESGEVSHRSNVYKIERNIRRQQNQIEIAVEKALVRSSATKFSRLPFPEHRYTPITDLLSHLILEGPIEPEELEEMNAADEQKYQDYIRMLEDVNLIRLRGETVVADDIFIEMQATEDTHPEMLNAALAHFFEVGADQIDTIREILGPYLAIAGYYYQKAIEVSDGFPSIPDAEFDEIINKRYAGNDRVQKKFKLSRYLIQLEEVGLLESDSQRDGSWRGKEGVKQNLLREDELLAPIADTMA